MPSNYRYQKSSLYRIKQRVIHPTSLTLNYGLYNIDMTNNTDSWVLSACQTHGP